MQNTCSKLLILCKLKNHLLLFCVKQLEVCWETRSSCSDTPAPVPAPLQSTDPSFIVPLFSVWAVLDTPWRSRSAWTTPHERSFSFSDLLEPLSELYSFLLRQIQFITEMYDLAKKFSFLFVSPFLSISLIESKRINRSTTWNKEGLTNSWVYDITTVALWSGFDIDAASKLKSWKLL